MKPTKKINLELDDQEAWFLTYLLDKCLRGNYTSELFKTNDEDGGMSFDPDFKNEIENIVDKLYIARGL